MPIIHKQICKTCKHFKQIQGLFGKCAKLDFKKAGHVFATNPACRQYDPIENFNSREAPHRNNVAAALFIPFLPGLAGIGGGIPSISNRFIRDNQPKVEERKEEWVNPIFRRKYPAQKVIKIAHGADGKMRRIP